MQVSATQEKEKTHVSLEEEDLNEDHMMFSTSEATITLMEDVLDSRQWIH